MSEIIATTPGLYPLPDWAKDELSDLKGHQKSDLVSGDEPPAVVEAYERARNEVVDRQREAGLDRIVEGQLRWDDMLAHPLAVHDNVETRGIVRYYDNNNFYREPVVRGELTPDGDVSAELTAAAELTDDLQAVLPGPYSLSDLATDDHYGSNFLDAIASFLAGEVEAFPPVDTVWLLEPSLAVSRPLDALSAAELRDAIDTVASVVDGDVVVHTYWGALEGEIYSSLLDTAIDAVGLDLISARDQNLDLIAEYGTSTDLALGVVDGQNTRIEDPGAVRSLVDEVLDSTPSENVETVYATVNTELFYLPVSSAEAKLDTLGQVTEEVVV